MSLNTGQFQAGNTAAAGRKPSVKSTLKRAAPDAAAVLVRKVADGDVQACRAVLELSLSNSTDSNKQRSHGAAGALNG